MKHLILSLFTGLLLLVTEGLAAETPHNGSIRGAILDAATQSPLVGATVALSSPERYAFTDELGFFQFNNLPAGAYEVRITFLGYEATTEQVEVNDSETTTLRVSLAVAPMELQAVEIRPGFTNHQQLISDFDIRMRPTATSQDILRSVPGLFIAQHAGGGKAEQIFLRGFDIDHGTDIALNVDGMPVNMVSHAHGQGYADLHFLIPETVERVQFAKGPYYAPYGNLATAGYVGFKTKNALEQSMLKVQGGQFDTYRLLGMFNLLDRQKGGSSQNAYLATEYFFSNGYFESPQAYSRFNTLFKYQGALSANTYLTIGGSAFSSRWDASGQIPERAVASGQISRLGAIDSTEGGATQRYTLNFQFNTALPDGSSLRQQFYYNRYGFELYSNFTFFLSDPENGDQIRQKEQRNLIGYNGAYRRSDQWLGLDWETTAGLSIRFDAVRDNELSRTLGRQATLSRLALGDVEEINAGLYLDETIHLSPQLVVNAGLRYDQFQFMYVDKLQTQYDRRIVSRGVVSPKLNAYLTLSDRLQLFANSGWGFHSNDTRVVVARQGQSVLPRAFGLESGAILKVTPRLLLTASAWSLDLEQEFVYVGDEAVVEPSGRTRRRGIDLAGRWQLADWLFADLDVNYTLARADDAPRGESYIPLAADWTSIGGLTFDWKNGLGGSLRYRYLGDRPANEDRSAIARGYYLLDALVSYTRPKWELGFSIQNLLNREWKEAQFLTESRLSEEPAPVSEIHFTPGTPFNLQVWFSYSF